MQESIKNAKYAGNKWKKKTDKKGLKKQNKTLWRNEQKWEQSSYSNMSKAK